MSQPLPSYKKNPDAGGVQMIIRRELLELLKNAGGLCLCKDFGHGKNLVIVLPDAKEYLFLLFQYGRGRTPFNVLEQQAKLYGHRFIDERDHYITVVTHAAYIYPSVRRGTFVATSGANADDFMEHRLRLEQSVVNEHEAQLNVDRYGRTRDPYLCFGPSVVVGQIHTHPGLSCFFSSTDHASNESTADVPETYLVCDPIGEDFKAMIGVNGEPARILFMEYADRAPASGAETREDAQPDSLSMLAWVCGGFLKKRGVGGKFRMSLDSRKKAHIKFNAHYRFPDAAALAEFEQIRKDYARR